LDELKWTWNSAECEAMIDKEPEPSGQKGLIDVHIIRALYRSIETGGFVQLDQFDRAHRPTAAQTINREPSQEKPELIHAVAPSGKS
jgi:hypothetical protein